MKQQLSFYPMRKSLIAISGSIHYAAAKHYLIGIFQYRVIRNTFITNRNRCSHGVVALPNFKSFQQIGGFFDSRIRLPEDNSLNPF